MSVAATTATISLERITGPAPVSLERTTGPAPASLERITGPATVSIERITGPAAAEDPRIVVEGSLNTMLRTTILGDMDAWCVALETLLTADGPATLYTHLYGRALDLVEELTRVGVEPTAAVLRALVGPLDGAAHLDATVTAVLDLLAVGAGPWALEDLHPVGVPIDDDRLTADGCALSLVVIALVGALAAVELGLMPGDTRPSMLVAHDRPGVVDVRLPSRHGRIDRACWELIGHLWPQR